MDDIDRVLDSFKVQIKKEIVDNYFAERVAIEEEVKFLDEDVRAYRERLHAVERLFQVLYQALGSDEVIAKVMPFLGPEPWPGYAAYQRMSAAERERLLAGRSRRGFTAYRRRLNLIQDVYDDISRKLKELGEQYAKIQAYLRLLNEDIAKFNLSFDFGLIAAQIEALEGGGAVIGGGLMSGEREELSTRMRFRPRALSDVDLPPPPVLPPLEEVQSRLAALL